MSESEIERSAASISSIPLHSIEATCYLLATWRGSLQKIHYHPLETKVFYFTCIVDGTILLTMKVLL